MTRQTLVDKTPQRKRTAALTAFPSGAPKFTFGFYWRSCRSIFVVVCVWSCVSLFVISISFFCVLLHYNKKHQEEQHERTCGLYYIFVNIFKSNSTELCHPDLLLCLSQSDIWCLSAISWREQVIFDEMKMMMSVLNKHTELTQPSAGRHVALVSNPRVDMSL